MKRIASLSLAAASLAALWAGGGATDEAAPAAPAPAPAAVSAAPAPAPVPARPAPEPGALIAKVNGSDVTEGDVQRVLDTFLEQMGPRITPAQLAEAMPRVRERIIEELIMRRLMLDAVAKEGVALSDAEFAEIKSELAAELPPGVSLETYMAETGVSETEMREQMTVRKMIISKAEATEKPTDEEIRAFYDENQEGFAQDSTVTASHILVKTDRGSDDAAKAAKLERLEGLRQQALAGADFAELARAHSDCPSASAGGSLGAFGRGQMVPPFEDAAFSQDVGVVGEIVETQFGYHLILVTEKTEAKVLDFGEVKERIADILYSQKQQDAVRDFVEGLREKASIERFDAPPSEDVLLQLEVEDVEEDAEELLDAAAEDISESIEEAAEEIAEDSSEEDVVVVPPPAPGTEE